MNTSLILKHIGDTHTFTMSSIYKERRSDYVGKAVVVLDEKYYIYGAGDFKYFINSDYVFNFESLTPRIIFKTEWEGKHTYDHERNNLMAIFEDGTQIPIQACFEITDVVKNFTPPVIEKEETLEHIDIKKEGLQISKDPLNEFYYILDSGLSNEENSELYDIILKDINRQPCWNHKDNKPLPRKEFKDVKIFIKDRFFITGEELQGKVLREDPPRFIKSIERRDAFTNIINVTPSSTFYQILDFLQEAFYNSWETQVVKRANVEYTGKQIKAIAYGDQDIIHGKHSSEFIEEENIK